MSSHQSTHLFHWSFVHLILYTLMTIFRCESCIVYFWFDAFFPGSRTRRSSWGRHRPRGTASRSTAGPPSSSPGGRVALTPDHGKNHDHQEFTENKFRWWREEKLFFFGHCPFFFFHLADECFLSEGFLHSHSLGSPFDLNEWCLLCSILPHSSGSVDTLGNFVEFEKARLYLT